MSHPPSAPSPASHVPASLAGSESTKLRLMQAAVRIFAERGFQATSMRAVTQMAGTSVSAANYHFGSKENLLRAALLERAGLLNEKRLQALAEAEAAAAGGALSVEAILSAYLGPLFARFAEAQAAEPEVGEVARGLALRLYMDPPEVVAGIRREIFEPVNQRFVEALARALPEAQPSQVEFALEVTMGAWIHFLVAHAAQADPAGEMSPSQLRRMVVFLAAGIEAVVSDAGGGP